MFKEIKTALNIFFLLISRLISIMAGKLSQHMAVSCIFFKKNFGGDLRLKLVRNRTLFTSSFYK